MSITKFTSPKGRASYPSLTSPDTRFSAEGVYKTGLIVSEKDAEKLIETLKEVFVEEFGAKKLNTAKMPYKANDDGTVTFNFKSKQKPKLFDSKGQPIRDSVELKVGSGSVVKIAGAAKAYNAGGSSGVTLYLNAVQIIDLVEYSSSPFGAEDGSFEASEETFSATEKEEEAIDF